MNNKILTGGEKYPTLLKNLGLTPIGILFLVVIGLLPFIGGNEYMTRIFVSALMTGTLAMAFDFTSGYINICNFGYAAFWGIGAYVSGCLVKFTGCSPFVGMIAATIAAAVCGALIGSLTIRLGGIFASCMCWFFSLGMIALATNLVDITNGSAGLRAEYLFKSTSNTPYFYLMFAITVAVYLLLTWMVNSNTGLAFRAIGQDLEAATSCGINHVSYKIVNFTISCALAGLIGAFYMHYMGIMTPVAMQNTKTVEVMAISYIGGRGTIWGALLSGMVMIPILESAKGLLEWRQVLYGAMMIVVMIFYPGGLAGLLKDGVALISKLGSKSKKKA